MFISSRLYVYVVQAGAGDSIEAEYMEVYTDYAKAVLRTRRLEKKHGWAEMTSREVNTEDEQGTP